MPHRFASTFAHRLSPTIRQLLSSPTPNQSSTTITVNGWVKSIRRQKKVSFAVISDGSSARGLQAVFSDGSLAKRCAVQSILSFKYWENILRAELPSFLMF